MGAALDINPTNHPLRINVTIPGINDVHISGDLPANDKIHGAMMNQIPTRPSTSWIQTRRRAPSLSAARPARIEGWRRR